MGVRDRLALLRKAFAPGTPAEILAGEVAAQMTPTSPFSPGEPVNPYDGYSRTPRTQDYVTGYNIATRPRTHERVAFDTLKGLVQAYDVAQMCIWHRIDSIRSLAWSLIPADGYRGDASDAIARGTAILAKPDRDHPFATWLSAYLYDVLAYDAGALYRMRNRRGDAIGLRTIDGTSIAPLLDYWGNTPADPAPAYVQYAQGLPWNWLRTRDLVYVPFRKRADSPYGTAPLESILLNANTDLRFQQYFLQRFTEGNIPEAFASAPESWSPQQIEDFQTYWDALMMGDQASKHQIKWLPGGSSLAWSNEKDFTDSFSLFLMRKTAAAYHVVPSDLGFTETVNLSSSESQSDVQHRVGDLPLIRHVQGILTSFLQDDCGLPVQFAFDLGEEQADRLEQAQADQIYIQMGAISSSEVREMRYGLPEADGKPVPRFIYSSRSGPIPLSALYGVAGPIDSETAAPAPDAPLPHTVFEGVPGTEPTPPVVGPPLAERLYGPSAVPDGAEEVGLERPVAKDAGAAPAAAAGITAGTGITGYDLDKGDDEDDEQKGQAREAELTKRELAAFRRFRQARRRAGTWRDFHFQHVDERTARHLNQGGRLAVRKAAGEVAVAGLAVQAADTGRVLMLQRALDPTDPAAGTWEFPGGHLEGEETPLLGAWREWAEETGCIPPPGQVTGMWTSPNGIYMGVVWQVPSEASVPITGGRDQVTNPDDPDGDAVEAIAWWDPAQLPDNPAVRPELLDALDLVLPALGQDDAEELAEVGKAFPPGQDYDSHAFRPTPGSEHVCWYCGMGRTDPTHRAQEQQLAKAGDDGPKGAGPADEWPGWKHDEKTAQHWAPLLAVALAAALTRPRAEQLARDYAATPQAQDTTGQSTTARTDTAAAWLAGQGLTLTSPALRDTVVGLRTDAYLIGTAAAAAVTTGQPMRLGGWKPGDTAKARTAIEDIDAAPGLTAALDQADKAAQAFADGRLRDIARALADAAAAGSTPADAATAMTPVDASRTLAATTTEITRVSAAAAQHTYRKHGMTEGRWLTEADGHECPTCAANEDAGPVPTGDPYPSGDTHPPAHPRCRCAVVPA